MSETQPLSLSTAHDDLKQHLAYLKLPFTAEQYAPMAKQAAHKQLSHVEYLAQLMHEEANLRKDRATQNRIRLARFPVIKTLDQFNWS